MSHEDVTRHAVSSHVLLRTGGRGTAPCTHATADCHQPQQQRNHRPHRHLRQPAGSPCLRLALRLLTRTRTGFTPAAHTVTRTHARTHARSQTSHTDALTSFSVWVLPKRSSPTSVQRRRRGSTASADGASPRCLGPRWLDWIHVSRFVTMRTGRHPLPSRPGCPTPAVLSGPSPPHLSRKGK